MIEKITKNKICFYPAFTLAEVLITLGIIGIVAAMTLPSMVANYQERQTVTALKKFYSSLSQAYFYAREEYGTPDSWYTDLAEQNRQAWSNRVLDIMTEKMKYTKKCYNDKGCFPDVVYKKIDGDNAVNWDNQSGMAKMITSDGMSVLFWSYGPDGLENRGTGHYKKTYSAVSVDINGFKNPNVFGKDMFSFLIAENGVLPVGSADSEINGKPSFPKGCNRTACYGHCESCAAWVITNENMDYLRCDDLSWGTKMHCK